MNKARNPGLAFSFSQPFWEALMRLSTLETSTWSLRCKIIPMLTLHLTTPVAVISSFPSPVRVGSLQGN